MLSGKNMKYFQRDDVGENSTYPIEINMQDNNLVLLNYNSVP